MVIWLIGLSGAGKTTLAEKVVNESNMTGSKTILIDGDIIRKIFNNDLGYSLDDRLKNAQRICQLCKFLDDNGINVVCAILSIFPQSREWNRKNIKNYYEVFIDTTIEQLIERDVKGIYKKYREGEISNVAGMDIEFPIPENPDLIIKNNKSEKELLDHSSFLVNLINK